MEHTVHGAVRKLKEGDVESYFSLCKHVLIEIKCSLTEIQLTITTVLRQQRLLHIKSASFLMHFFNLLSAKNPYAQQHDAYKQKTVSCSTVRSMGAFQIGPMKEIL